MRPGIERFARVGKVDLVVVGSGLAGLAAAHEACAAGARVLVVTAGNYGDGASRHAQGGIAIACDTDDVVAHIADTLGAGRGLCDTAAVGSIIGEGSATLVWLEGHGVRFDAGCGMEGGHSRARVRHRGGDRTGAHITGAVSERLLGQPNAPEVASCHRVISLCHNGSRITGVLMQGTNHPVTVDAGAVILATGGLGRLYARSTNPAGACGEGVALGVLAGAVARDMEFVQFHPTVTADGTLLTEALRGAGARLVNAAGDYFMRRYEPEAGDLAPRDVVARAVRTETLAHGGVFLDLRSVAALEQRFPSLAAWLLRSARCRALRCIPISPAAHYAVGGLETDLEGRTTLDGLYAAGEVASTGLHGANRLASNSMLEALVMGRRAARATLHELPAIRRSGQPLRTRCVARDAVGWLPAAMDASAGVSRNGVSLDALEKRLVQVWSRTEYTRHGTGSRHVHQALAADLVVHGALLRTESLGVHWREDAVADAGEAPYHIEVTYDPGAQDENGRGALVCRKR